MTEFENRPEIKFQPWLFEKEDDLKQIKNPEIRKEAILLEKTPSFLRNEERLSSSYLKVEEIYRQKKIDKNSEDEAIVLMDKITKKAEELTRSKKESEPEIVMLKRPENSEEAVTVFFKEIFNLHEKGLRENKSWEKQGELFSEFTTIQRWVEDVPREASDLKGQKHSDLSKALERNYPEGIFLKEKMELFLEAMKRLHNREIEVVKSDGGLEDLGVGKSGESAAPILKVPLTNIRPVDWYVLTHVDELFSESNKPENKINLESAWSKWQEIGKYPYGFFQKREINDKNGEKKIEKALIEGLSMDEQEKMIKKNEGEYGLVRWDLKNFKKIKSKFLSKDELEKYYTIKNIFTSERIMSDFRLAIAQKISQKDGNLISGIRAEVLAYSLLRVSLTLDMWDRERWKDKGKQEVRDLMWFDWKRIKNFKALRPAGPWDTVGCFFADETQMNKDFGKEIKTQIDRKELKTRKRYIERNKKRALFIVKPTSPSIGTIVGDFFSSATFMDDDKNFKRLADVRLKEIPWLDPGKFETETYEGYFTYSLLFAASMDSDIKNLEWKPEDLKSKDFWTKKTHLTLRFGHFCPSLLSYNFDDKEKRVRINQIIYNFRRIIARGILWTGSHLATARPGGVLSKGSLSADDVYGAKAFGVFKSKPGILDAISFSGYLTKKDIEILKREIYEFNFHLRGGPTSFR